MTADGVRSFRGKKGKDFSFQMKKECPFCPGQCQEVPPFVLAQGGSVCAIVRTHDIFAARRDESAIVGYYTFDESWAPQEKCFYRKNFTW